MNKKNTHYREYYKRYYEIDFGEQYDVHHIDGDRSNNNIANLVLLPKFLHTEYHVMKTKIENMGFPTKITGNGPEVYRVNCFEQFIKIINECNKWHDYKMYLEGKLPNMHNIKL